MIKIGSSNVRKFQFFEVVNEPNSISTSKNEIKDSNKESTKLDQNKSNIEINNISLSGTGQMYAIDELIFINGKAIHEKDGNKVRENLIMKILDNKIIDEYRLFNGIYFYFSIKIYEEKPYFIVVGSDFNEHLNKGQKRYNMTTSIKIYDASLFIKNKTLNETKEEELGESEPYPESLIKNIKLLKRLSDGEFLSEYDLDKVELYPSIILSETMWIENPVVWTEVDTNSMGHWVITSIGQSSDWYDEYIIDFNDPKTYSELSYSIKVINIEKN